VRLLAKCLTRAPAHRAAPQKLGLQPVEGTYLAIDTCRMAKMIKRLPAGFVIPAQPVLASKPLSGADWVHEIKHDGYRIMVRRDGPIVRLDSRNANDWTVATGGDRRCCRADQDQELHDRW
jgi:ATP-dependent DNA ligase